PTRHSVGLSGLTPPSKYYSRYITGTDTHTDGSDCFRTAPATTEPFRFVAFGDIGRATPEQIQLAARIDSLNADLGILTGDIIYEGGEAANFTPQYFDIYRKTIARIPFYSCLGNHDVVTANGQPYLDAFYFPTANSGTERYYSFDYSNAHFASIEVTLENVAPNSAMLAWLSSDLAATNKQWKIVFFHVAMYSNLGAHGVDVPSNPVAVLAIARDGCVIDAMTLTKDSPTAVAIVEFFADSRPEGVHLEWRVSAESDAAGFHVYRGSTLADISTRLTTSPL